MARRFVTSLIALLAIGLFSYTSWLILALRRRLKNLLLKVEPKDIDSLRLLSSLCPPIIVN